MKGKRVIRGVLIGLAGVLVLLFAVVQIALNSRVLTRAVNRIAAEFVDGNVSFSKVHASAFRSFPHLNVTLDDCVLTYPHEKFARYDSLCNEDLAARRFSLVKAGWGESGVDTLASFRQLSASINYISVLKGDYDIRHVTLSRPRIFAHMYDSTAANWDILPLGSKDTTDSPLPPVTVRKLDLTDRPLIIFTDPTDTLFGLFTLRNLRFDGKVLITELTESQIGLKIDSLFVSGRLPADTVAVAIDRLALEGEKRCLDLDMSARAFLATQQYGRMTVPVRIKGSGCMPEREDSVTAVSVKDLLLNVASLEMTGNGDAVLYPDSTFLRAEASIADCAVAPILEQFKANFPVLGKVRTDAVISLTALCDGYYNPQRGTLPELLAELVVPRSSVDYEGIGRRGYVSLNAAAETNEDLRLDVDVRDLMVDILGIGLSATGSAKDLLGDDPAFRIAGHANARVDSLTQAFTKQRGITGTGRLTLDLEGDARLSQLDAVHIGDATLNGDLRIRDLRIEDRPDSLSVRMPAGTVNLSTMANTLDKNLKKGTRVLGLKANLDTLDLVYKEALLLHGGGLKLLAHTSAGHEGDLPHRPAHQAARLPETDPDLAERAYRRPAGREPRDAGRRPLRHHRQPPPGRRGDRRTPEAFPRLAPAGLSRHAAGFAARETARRPAIALLDAGCRFPEEGHQPQPRGNRRQVYEGMGRQRQPLHRGRAADDAVLPAGERHPERRRLL